MDLSFALELAKHRTWVGTKKKGASEREEHLSARRITRASAMKTFQKFGKVTGVHPIPGMTRLPGIHLPRIGFPQNSPDDDVEGWEILWE